MAEKMNNNIEQQPTILAALQYAKKELRKCNRCENIGELILLDILKMARSEMLANLKQILSVSTWTLFQELLTRHVNLGEPVQYLTGKESFCGNRFFVNEHVLIPRPETEELIYNVILAIRAYFNDTEQKQLVIADIGTGSGVIAITMQLKYKLASVYAIDISDRALNVAQMNATKLGASNINFWHGNLAKPLLDRHIMVNVLVANLPYIPLGQKKHLRDTVRNYEPDIALYSGNDGLDMYRELISQLTQILAPRAIIGFEIGCNQSETILSLLQEHYPHGQGQCLFDISGNERMVLFRL